MVPGQLVPTDWSASDWSRGTHGAPGAGSEYMPAHLSPGNEAVAVYTGRGAPPAPPIGPVYDRKGTHRTKRENGPWRELVIITAVAVIVSAVILAVTTAEKSNVAGLNSLFGSPGTTAGAASRPPSTAAGVATDHPSAVSSTTPNSQTALTAASKGATPATLSQQAKSLPVTPGVANSLLSSWLASNPGGYGMGPTDVDGTVSNEVYYAVQPATGTYWALAAFKPSPHPQGSVVDADRSGGVGPVPRQRLRFLVAGWPGVDFARGVQYGQLSGRMGAQGCFSSLEALRALKNHQRPAQITLSSVGMTRRAGVSKKTEGQGRIGTL